jgi:hypothetical protein
MYLCTSLEGNYMHSWSNKTTKTKTKTEQTNKKEKKRNKHESNLSSIVFIKII